MWTYGPDNIPFEVQTGGVGGLTAQDGVALVELDSDTFGNPSHQPPSAAADPQGHTDATIQQVIAGTQAGQPYELDFWYSPRPGDGANNDSGLNVLWNGVVVHSINSSGQPEGVWQNVAAILDDEDTTSRDSEFRAVQATMAMAIVATGQILFNAGTDGLKSIEVHGINGLQAIYVDANGVGHPEIRQLHVVRTSFRRCARSKGLRLISRPCSQWWTMSGHYTFTLVAPLDHPVT